MAGKNSRIVYRRPDGEWVNLRNGAKKPAGIHDTQKDARDEAKAMLKKSGGGELTVKGLDGKIKSKDTIPPANDPCPPKDKEH